jgi:hypothetical protein
MLDQDAKVRRFVDVKLDVNGAAERNRIGHGVAHMSGTATTRIISKSRRRGK